MVYHRGVNDSFDRYQRQMLLPQLGQAGQRQLVDAHVLLVGCGALGCVIADQLIRAGLGQITLIDRDFVELANLHRQPLFDEADAAKALPKAIAAQRQLQRINSTVHVHAHVADFNASNARSLANGCSVLVDGTDNFETRYLLNDLAVSLAKPYVYGGVVGTRGTQFNVLPACDGTSAWEQAGGAGPCLRCIWPDAPGAGQTETCDTAGVLGSAVSLVASMQVIETIKIITGAWAEVSRSIRDVDAWSGQVRQVDASAMREAQCPCCGERRFDYLDGQAGATAVSLCGRNAVQVMPKAGLANVDLEAIAARLAQVGSVRQTPYTLRCEIEFAGTTHEVTLFADGRAIIKGTGEPTAARTLYSRYIGL
jgi:molybdopterin/thiamine biosynthesis adenylyltransferase